MVTPASASVWTVNGWSRFVVFVTVRVVSTAPGIGLA
jgi:hypothetical protein